jgi:hypothetical protein
MNIINDLGRFEDKRHLRTFCNVLEYCLNKLNKINNLQFLRTKSRTLLRTNKLEDKTRHNSLELCLLSFLYCRDCRV